MNEKTNAETRIDRALAREARARQVFWLSTGATVVVLLIALLYGWPRYNVWRQGQIGKATLAKAEQTKTVLVETARAELAAAKLRAEAIAVIGQAAKDYPEYRRQEYLQALGESLANGNVEQVIYIPTEAQLPITEAAKR
jgi:regulator of protease activity HflC (stomatin/prohibitin superfamily)